MTAVPGTTSRFGRNGSRIPDLGFRIGTGTFAWLVVGLIIALGALLLVNGGEALSTFGVGFLTGTTWDPIAGLYGALPFIVGTIGSALIAIVIATPIGLLTAIFLAELAPRAQVRPQRDDLRERVGVIEHRQIEVGTGGDLRDLHDASADLFDRRRIEPRPRQDLRQRIDVVGDHATPQQRRFQRSRAASAEGVVNDIARIRQPLDEETRHLRLEARAIGDLVQRMCVALLGGPELVDVDRHQLGRDWTHFAERLLAELIERAERFVQAHFAILQPKPSSGLIDSSTRLERMSFTPGRPISVCMVKSEKALRSATNTCKRKSRSPVIT